MVVALEIAVLHSVANDIAKVIVALKQSQSNACRWIQLLKLDCQQQKHAFICATWRTSIHNRLSQFSLLGFDVNDV